MIHYIFYNLKTKNLTKSCTLKKAKMKIGKENVRNYLPLVSKTKQKTTATTATTTNILTIAIIKVENCSKNLHTYTLRK